MCYKLNVVLKPTVPKNTAVWEACAAILLLKLLQPNEDFIHQISNLLKYNSCRLFTNISSSVQYHLHVPDILQFSPSCHTKCTSQHFFKHWPSSMFPLLIYKYFPTVPDCLKCPLAYWHSKTQLYQGCIGNMYMYTHAHSTQPVYVYYFKHPCTYALVQLCVPWMEHTLSGVQESGQGQAFFTRNQELSGSFMVTKFYHNCAKWIHKL